MRITFCMFFLLLLIKSSLLFSQVAINADGSNPNNSALLDVKSNTKGFLPPRMTHAEMNAIPNPADGLIVYCTDCLPNGKGVLATFTDNNWKIVGLNCMSPLTPSASTNIPSKAGILWDWKGVPFATGYKWNILNDYVTATQMDTVTTKTETGLACNTSYTRYVWAYNTCGNSLTLTLTQTTLPCSIPILSTIDVSYVSSTSATSGGNITSDGGSAITVRGVCWGTAKNPTTANSTTSDGSGIGDFASNLTGLTEETTYYLRAYATNSAGTGYGSEITFNTLPGIPTVTDIDGNIYTTVTIGTQTWMVENLKTTKYRNGDPISNETDNTAWAGLTDGAYCWYNNGSGTDYEGLPVDYMVYGGLYNWYAVSDSRNIAPEGWHVPTDAEWTILTNFLGGEDVAGGKMKTRAFHWQTPIFNDRFEIIGYNNIPDITATNQSGFSAFPGGFRSNSDGAFLSHGNLTAWWSSTIYDANNVWIRSVNFSYAGVGRYSDAYGNIQSGLSVRCIKD